MLKIHLKSHKCVALNLYAYGTVPKKIIFLIESKKACQNSKSLAEGFCGYFLCMSVVFLGGQALNAAESISRWLFNTHIIELSS